MTDTVFGYSWEEIQARQQKTYRPKLIVFAPLPTATQSDLDALAKYGSIDALRAAGMMGIVDRLSR